MNKFLVLGVGLLSAAAAASAAEIHGTVSESNKPVPQGVALQLACGGATAEAKTDEFGSYSLKIAATGECRLSLDYKGSSGSLTVTLYEKPGRYDLAVRQEAGKLVLTRK